MLTKVKTKWRNLVRSRVMVGVLLIGISIAGVFGVIQSQTRGVRVLLAADFLPAGSVISEADLAEARILDPNPTYLLETSEVIGQTLGTDVGPGELITQRMFEPTLVQRVSVAVPLGYPPAQNIESGSNVSVWVVDKENNSPPVAVSNEATVTELSDSGFGADILATLLVNFTDVDRLLAATSSRRHIVITTGETP